jgi:transcriptional regulator with XRE-family HTH domain
MQRYPFVIYPRGMTGTELRALRRRAGHSQRTLALALGMNPNSLAILERGERPVRQVVALAVRSVCSVPKPKEGRTHER